MPPPGNPSARMAARIEREIRDRKAVELAIAGHGYQEIADQLGYNSRQAAFTAVKRALAPASKALRESADHFLAVQAERIEQMHRDARAIFEEYKPPTADDLYDADHVPAADQRLAALDRVAKASAEFRKLLGLDAPAKTENKTTLDGTVGYHVAVAPEELDAL
jgi:AraC-like DNA-binding protein